ncbi:MAG: type II toxin-antitoxin system ParD family antitoxin [Azonexus sp.]|jgi:antitoxin ParD1/3/4|nr:type II toxin-antitoxin system ParD family antitoxin [Azonexus sp.]
MPTRNVVITDRQASFIEQMVDAGRYQNASEVLREGLRMVEQREAENAARLQALRQAIEVGIDDIEAGRYTALRTAEELDAHFRALAAKALAEA